MTFEREPNVQPSAQAPPMLLTGRTVLDNRAAKVGKVTDVLFDDRGPDWAVVKTGPLGGEHFAPLDRSYVDLAGRLVMPLEKREIRHAPRVGRDHVISSRERNELRDYYGVAA